MFLSLLRVARNNIEKIITRAIIGFAIALASSGTNAAIMTPTESDCIHGPDSATCTFADLFGPDWQDGEIGSAEVSVDRISFSGWTFLGSDDELADVMPEDVSVTFSEDGRRINLDFSSEKFNAFAGVEGNYTFAYRVLTPNDPPDLINKIDISLLDYNVGGTVAQVVVSTCFAQECLTDPLLIRQSFEVFAERFDNVPDDETFKSIPLSTPLRSFPVSTNIFVTGSNIPGELVGFGEVEHFRQSFYRVPEPGTLALILLPGLMLVGRNFVSNFRR